MFERNKLADFPYLISPHDINLYENLFNINIQVFFR